MGDCHDIAEILLKVALNTITLSPLNGNKWFYTITKNLFLTVMVKNTTNFDETNNYLTPQTIKHKKTTGIFLAFLRVSASGKRTLSQ